MEALDKARTFSLPEEVGYAEGFYNYTDAQLELSLSSVFMMIMSEYLKVNEK